MSCCTVCTARCRRNSAQRSTQCLRAGRPSVVRTIPTAAGRRRSQARTTSLEAFVTTTRMLAVAGFVLAAAFPAAAQDTSIEHVRALIAQAQAQTGAAPAPVQAVPPFRTPGPRVDITIEDAVARGTEKNIDIAVARITPRLTDFTIAGLEASYRLNLTSAASNNKTTDLPRVTTQGIST